MYRFAPAASDESIVFGAAKPQYSETFVQQWLEFMQGQEIERICCLLEPKTCNRYQPDLLTAYQQTFGKERVLWQPEIADFQIPNPTILIESIIPFLISADQEWQKVVVHCSHGVGRTGIVLAAWLVGEDFPISKPYLLSDNKKDYLKKR